MEGRLIRVSHAALKSKELACPTKPAPTIEPIVRLFEIEVLGISARSSVTLPTMSNQTPTAKGSGFAVAEESGYQHHDKQNASPTAAATIAEKYKGTRADQDDMVLLGKKQVLRRNFRFTTILGFASTGKFLGNAQVVNLYQADVASSAGCVGDASSPIRLCFAGWRHGDRVLGVDRRCHRHDICLHIFGRNGVHVSSAGYSSHVSTLMLTTVQVPHGWR